jgi:hypothetical protein
MKNRTTRFELDCAISTVPKAVVYTVKEKCIDLVTRLKFNFFFFISQSPPVFDCAVALCTMQNELLVISNLKPVAKDISLISRGNLSFVHSYRVLPAWKLGIGPPASKVWYLRALDL